MGFYLHVDWHEIHRAGFEFRAHNIENVVPGIPEGKKPRQKRVVKLGKLDT